MMTMSETVEKGLFTSLMEDEKFKSSVYYLTLSYYSPTLEETQKFVGGLIEMKFLHGEQVLWNEEGLMRELPFNDKASHDVGFDLVGNVLRLKDEAQME